MIDSINDDNPRELTWTMTTVPEKLFFLRANSMEDKQRFITVMNTAVELKRKQTENKEPSKLSAAIELGRNGFVDKAKQILLELIDIDKSNSEALFHLGTCYFVEGNEPMAIQVFDQCLEMIEKGSDTNTLYFEILNNLGLCNFILGNFDVSKELFGKIHRSRPRDFVALTNLSAVHIECGEFADAERVLLICLNDPKPSVHALLNWVTVLRASDKTAAALDSLKKLVTLYPDCHDGYFMLGEVFEHSGDYSKAAESFQIALSLNSHKMAYANALANARTKLAEITVVEDEISWRSNIR